MRHSRTRPFASRVFANELLSGAPYLTDLSGDRFETAGRSQVAHHRGLDRRRPDGGVDPRHLFFMIWAMTQTYADFAVQIRAVMNVESLSDTAWEGPR